MTKNNLTPRQQQVMVAALRHRGVPRNPHVPYGVYRSLVIKGLLTFTDHYELTEQGRLLFAAEPPK